MCVCVEGLGTQAYSVLASLMFTRCREPQAHIFIYTYYTFAHTHTHVHVHIHKDEHIYVLQI